MLRNKKSNICIHDFDVVLQTKTGQSLVQHLYCKICKKHFLGYGGTLKKPMFIHQLKHNISSKALESPNVIEKVGDLHGKN